MQGWGDCALVISTIWEYRKAGYESEWRTENDWRPNPSIRIHKLKPGSSDGTAISLSFSYSLFTNIVTVKYIVFIPRANYISSACCVNFTQFSLACVNWSLKIECLRLSTNAKWSWWILAWIAQLGRHESTWRDSPFKSVLRFSLWEEL